MSRAALLAVLISLTSSTRTRAAQPAEPPVDLLRTTPTVVAVSSTVANARILPTHLVDGDLATAWNSRTGDLVGAWLAARIPYGAHVTAIRMSVGFAHVDRGQDLFTMNPRIKRVRVWHNESSVEHSLDPEDRGLQEIAVDIPGGDIRIEVVEVVPGTKRAWREICVSELQVWGTLPRGGVPVPSTPAVQVGSLDAAVAHDANTVADLAKIRVAWNSLATGSRVGLAFPFFAEAHDVAYLREPECSKLTLDLATPNAKADSHTWHCLGTLLGDLGVPDRTAREAGACCGWIRSGLSSLPPARADAYRERAKRGARIYYARVPVSAQDMGIIVQVDADGVSSLVLDLE